MNARKRALLKYGSYGSGALVSATLAALGNLKVSPLLMGPVHRAFLMMVAIAMTLQALALSRTKKQDCFIVRREELIGGSLTLFTGAALLLVLMLAGCSPAAAKRSPKTNFYGGESTATWTLFGADGPRRFAAQDLPRKTQDTNQTACRRTRSCRLAGLGSQSLRCSRPRWRVCAGRINRCPELATIGKEYNEV